MSSPKTQTLRLDQLRLDGQTQPRAAMNPALIAEYAERMEAGDTFPPVIAFYDGAEYWLADGFHRACAASDADRETTEAIVIAGPERAATQFSLGANAAHGARRTNADKTRAVKIALADPEWAKLSDSAVAELCAVSHKTVAKHRAHLGNSQVTARTGRDGRTTNTANIGKSQKAPTRQIVTKAEYEAQAAAEAAANAEIPPPASDLVVTALTDALGKPIPERCRGAFAGLDDLDTIAKALSRAKAMVTQHIAQQHPTFAAVNLTQLQADLTNARRALTSSAPYAVCPGCAGDGCKLCNTRGWIGKHTYRTCVPAELKATA